MTSLPDLAAVPDPTSHAHLARVGVVDVGSNSVRLVIFDGAARSPAYFFNEKVLCGLGRGVADTGRLNPNGKIKALAALRRFQAIAQGLDLPPLLAVATAAMREAEDGPEFCAQIAAETGVTLRVIDGTEEARLAAQGVLLGWPEARGLVCDIGGSSMELAMVGGGEIGWRRTAPLGPLELARLGPGDRAKAWIEDHLTRLRKEMPAPPERLFLVGGSWRAIARIDMHRRDYPLKVLHEYRLARADLDATLELIEHSDPASLRKGPGISSDRMALVPMAAKVLRGVLDVLGPRAVYISAYGLREGLLYDQMPPELRAADPLIAACAHAEARSARTPGFGHVLFRFLTPLYAEAPAAERRLVLAACLLHDVSWRTHPDYRPDVCFDYATRANLGGLTHADRVFLGLALMNRYKSTRSTPAIEAMRGLIPSERVVQAEALGRALRFGAMFTLGATRDMGRLDWDAPARRLTLHLTAETRELFTDAAETRLAALARALDAEMHVSD